MLWNILKPKEQSQAINKDITIILDNGHGKNTQGKCSPKFEDGSRFYEYEFSRDIVRRIAEDLKKAGIKYEILVPEENDISLTERCNRANKIWKNTGKKCFLISIHANAAGMGNQWMNARGWSVWTSRGRTKSDDIATVFWEEMKTEFPNNKMRMDTADGDVDCEANFAMLYNTKCPAILTENFFQDNKEDCKLLRSEAGRIKIANAHVRAIKKTLMKLY